MGIILALWITAGPALGLSGSAAEFDRGLKAYDAGQYAAAFQIWWKIRDHDLAAMRNVALMLRKGQGVAKAPRKAEEILQFAAATGMADAQVDLAEMYLNGETGAPEPKLAAPLLKKAAAAGHPLGQYLLAQMYESGNGLPEDMSKATELYISAARGGLHEAKLRLASLGDAKAKAASPAKPGSEAGQTPSGNTLLVQVGSFTSAEAAEAEWLRLKTQLSSSVISRRIEKADLGPKGVWYRLLVAGGPTRNSAVDLCNQIKASGAGCLMRGGAR